MKTLLLTLLFASSAVALAGPGDVGSVGEGMNRPLNGIYQLEPNLSSKSCFNTIVVSRAYKELGYETSTSLRTEPIDNLTMIAFGSKAVKLTQNPGTLITDFGNLDPSELQNARFFHNRGACKSNVTSYGPGLGTARIPLEWASACITEQNENTLVASIRARGAFFVVGANKTRTISIQRHQNTDLYEISGNEVVLEKDGVCQYKKVE